MAPKRKSDTIATSEVIPSAQAVPATKSSGPAPPPKKKQEQKQKQKQARPRSSTPIEAVPLYLSDRGFTTQRPAGLQEPAAGPVLTRTGGPSNGKAPLRFQVFDSGAQQRLATTSTPSNVQVTSVPPDVPDDSTPSDVHVDAGGNVYVGPTKEELSKMNRTQLKAAFKEETKAQELAQFEDDVARDDVEVYDDCNEIRRKIRLLQKEPGFKVTHWLREIGGINSNSLGRFMKATGPTGGAGNAIYPAAYIYFERKRIKEGKKKTAKREDKEDEHPEGFSTEIPRQCKYIFGVGQPAVRFH